MKPFKILLETFKNGGNSVNPLTGEIPEKGYMVSLQGTEVRKNLKQDLFYLEQSLTDYIQDNKETLKDEFLGTWISKGTLFIYVSLNILDRDEAIKIGKENNQLAIYDIVRGKEIIL